MNLITRSDDERMHKETAPMSVSGALYKDSLRAALEKLERTERLWSEDRAAVKDWAAASDAIGELYEILGVTKDSAGFEDGFKKIVAATRAVLADKEKAEQQRRSGFCIFCGEVIYRRSNKPMTDEQLDEYIRLFTEHEWKCEENPVLARVKELEAAKEKAEGDLKLCSKYLRSRGIDVIDLRRSETADEHIGR